MGFAPIYLLNRVFFRLTDFFHHWYVNGSRWFGHSFISLIESLDRHLALRLTIKFFWKPLYGDYSAVGRFLGVIFRTIRIVIALVVYVFCALVSAALYAIWLLIPFMPLYIAYRNLLVS